MPRYRITDLLQKIESLEEKVCHTKSALDQQHKDCDYLTSELDRERKEYDTNTRMRDDSFMRMQTQMETLRAEMRLKEEIHRLSLENANLRVALAKGGLAEPAASSASSLVLNGIPVTRDQILKMVAESPYCNANSLFIPAIRAVRELTCTGLKEAKDFCDKHFSDLKNPPQPTVNVAGKQVFVPPDFKTHNHD